VLDLFLAISITLSILILMTALFIQTPLEFSAFPTVLLISTMLRLSLNLASTRLILSHGHEGTAAAGHVIEAFGNFVMSGNFVIGIIVFTILVIVNFVVITKGSGRIAEVAARFHLDSMPGKQMAIDADLSAGLIDEKTAKQRRKELEDESGFFGAMDGASKFVRGDAIAGLLVVFINVIGGIIIGVAQQGMGFADAARTYTLLTVGDGLVTQVPALIVSTAAGLLVSKAGVTGAADKAMMKQLSGYPQALGMSSGVMLVLGMLPGIPMLPFLLLGGGAGLRGPHVTATTPPRSRKHAKPRHLPQQPLPLQQPRSRSPAHSRSTTSRSNWVTRSCRWSTGRMVQTALPTRSRRCAARSPPRWAL
jgi:flagellar biosynthesis protein FlhA